jgi:predicted HD phosphohydrolase
VTQGPAKLAPRAAFAAMAEATHTDWLVIDQYTASHQAGLADRVLAHLKLLDGDDAGYPVDRLEHCLQTASRAHRAGEDEEYVVCALLHDIGDTLGAANHADIAAALLEPYVSSNNHWMVQKHAVFQGAYYFGYFGLDPDMRDRYRGHPAFEQTAAFCALYDQSSFDAGYQSMPLAAFEPMVRRLFAQPQRSIYLKPPTPGSMNTGRDEYEPGLTVDLGPEDQSV